MYYNLAVIAVFAFLYSVIAGGVSRTVITGPMIFASFGLIVGPLGLGIFTLDTTSQILRALADLTLALMLYIEAANADLAVLRRSFQIPQRMLLIGLPLNILLGIGIGIFIFKGLAIFEIAILATMLAATDAALGKAVVTHEEIPANIREGLNVESGLNDGICVPVLFVFIALATGSGTEDGGIVLALKLVFREIGIGIAVGLVLTFIGAWALKKCWQYGWIDEVWIQIPVVALAMACFATAQSAHGSGYIAAFVGGLLFGSIVKKSKHELLLAAEGTGEVFALITWVVFGSAVIGQVLGNISWQVVLYALLSLTVIRMLSIFLSLTGSGEMPESKLFLAWFGPRGLASVVFAIIVLNSGVAAAGTLAMTVVCTVSMSIFAHGLTANPLASALGAKIKRLERR